MSLASIGFDQKLARGLTGEEMTACWLRSRGWTVLPAYEKVIDTGKGPRLYTAYNSGHGKLVSPDILALKSHEIKWVEGKRKTAFSWRYTRGVWQDGIDLRHYQDYLLVKEDTNKPLWITFLHESDRPSDIDLYRKKPDNDKPFYECPPACPVGLYGGEIDYLKTVVAHKDMFEANGRSYPMVYWDIARLTRLATLEEVLNASRSVA